MLITIEEIHQGVRLDQCLSFYLEGKSRAHCQRIIREGGVVHEGRPLCKLSHKVHAGEVYHITVPEPIPLALIPEDIPLDILYEDDHIVVLNKAAGMVVHPGAGHHEHTLIHALLQHCGESLSGIGGVHKPGIVHRLDKETSGLMVVAKTDAAHQGLSVQFAERTLTKVYWAFVWGMPTPVSGQWEGAIGRHPHERKKMAVRSEGRSALTVYRLLKTAHGISLLECLPKTGRTHQIRVHCATHRHPLVSDRTYGGKRHGTLCRHALHAKELTFTHPHDGKRLHFSCPLPEDLKALYAYLETH